MAETTKHSEILVLSSAQALRDGTWQEIDYVPLPLQYLEK